MSRRLRASSLFKVLRVLEFRAKTYVAIYSHEQSIHQDV